MPEKIEIDKLYPWFREIVEKDIKKINITKRLLYICLLLIPPNFFIFIFAFFSLFMNMLSNASMDGVLSGVRLAVILFFAMLPINIIVLLAIFKKDTFYILHGNIKEVEAQKYLQENRNGNLQVNFRYCYHIEGLNISYKRPNGFMRLPAGTKGEGFYLVSEPKRYGSNYIYKDYSKYFQGYFM